jgi:hypothetical protein
MEQLAKRAKRGLPREQIEGIAVRDGEKFTVLSTMRVQRKANEMRERNRCMKVQNSCRSYRHVCMLTFPLDDSAGTCNSNAFARSLHHCN